jgi:hypothetical protein
MHATEEPEDFPFLAENSRRRQAVLRRGPAPLMVLAAALAFGLGLQPLSSRADTLTSNSNTSNTATVTLEYTLTTSQAIAAASGSPPAAGSSNAPTPQVLALVNPVSIVTPPSGSSSGPLQIVSDSSGYYYNNPSELSVEVGNNPSNGSAITQQALGLTFYGQGLTANESVTFTLTFDKSIVDGSSPQIPQFTVVNPSNDDPISTIQIKYDGEASGNNGSSSTSTTTGQSGTGQPTVSETPEPLSLLVWSALAGAGIWRVRARAQRSRPRP